MTLSRSRRDEKRLACAVENRESKDESNAQERTINDDLCSVADCLYERVGLVGFVAALGRKLDNVFKGGDKLPEKGGRKSTSKNFTTDELALELLSMHQGNDILIFLGEWADKKFPKNLENRQHNHKVANELLHNFGFAGSLAALGRSSLDNRYKEKSEPCGNLLCAADILALQLLKTSEIDGAFVVLGKIVSAKKKSQQHQDRSVENDQDDQNHDNDDEDDRVTEDGLEDQESEADQDTQHDDDNHDDEDVENTRNSQDDQGDNEINKADLKTKDCQDAQDNGEDDKDDRNSDNKDAHREKTDEYGSKTPVHFQCIKIENTANTRNLPTPNKCVYDTPVKEIGDDIKNLATTKKIIACERDDKYSKCIAESNVDDHQSKTESRELTSPAAFESDCCAHNDETPKRKIFDKAAEKGRCRKEEKSSVQNHSISSIGDQNVLSHSNYKTSKANENNIKTDLQVKRKYELEPQSTDNDFAQLPPPQNNSSTHASQAKDTAQGTQKRSASARQSKQNCANNSESRAAKAARDRKRRKNSVKDHRKCSRSDEKGCSSRVVSDSPEGLQTNSSSMAPANSAVEQAGTLLALMHSLPQANSSSMAPANSAVEQAGTSEQVALMHSLPQANSASMAPANSVVEQPGTIDLLARMHSLPQTNLSSMAPANSAVEQPGPSELLALLYSLPQTNSSSMAPANSAVEQPGTSELPALLYSLPQTYPLTPAMAGVLMGQNISEEQRLFLSRLSPQEYLSVLERLRSSQEELLYQILVQGRNSNTRH